MKKLNLIIVYTLSLSSMLAGCNSGGLAQAIDNQQKPNQMKGEISLKYGEGLIEYNMADLYSKVSGARYNINQPINYGELAKILMNSVQFKGYAVRNDYHLFKIDIYSNMVEVTFVPLSFIINTLPVSIPINQYELQRIIGYPQQSFQTTSQSVISYANQSSQNDFQQYSNQAVGLNPTNAHLMERNEDLVKKYNY